MTRGFPSDTFAPVSDTELWRWSAIDLARAIRERRISSREAVESALARNDRINPKLNAVVDLLRDEALEAAERADKDVAEGRALGSLHGVPVTFKINVDYAGRSTTDGVVAFRDRIAQEDSSSVVNWKKAGAICIGRTNVPEFSARYFTDNSLHGRTLNPWAADRTPGGSSGGAAAAVCAGIGALAHGNDRAGSIRYPAYACGVFGLRPSFGRVPGFSATIGDRTQISQLTNVQGPLARSIADLRLGFTALADFDPRDPWHIPVPVRDDVSCGPCRVALFDGIGGKAPVASEVSKSLQQAAAALSNAGYEVEEAVLPYFDEAASLFFSLVKTEENGIASDLIEKLGDERIKRARASTMSHAVAFDLKGYVGALQRRTAILRAWQLFLERYPIILMPVALQLPFPIDLDQSGDEVVGTMLDSFAPLLAVSLLGLPGLAVPISIEQGMPVGVQIVAGRFQEALCFAAGEVLEAQFPMPLPLSFPPAD